CSNSKACARFIPPISSIFPYYKEHYQIGGMKRAQALEFEQLTIEDLEYAIRDARENADKIYRDIYAEFSYATDLNRHVQAAWKLEAHEAMKLQQEMVIDDLEEKVKQAPESASDEFLYQDREEAEKELAVARDILQHLPKPLHKTTFENRVWNTLPYDRYRGNDEE